MMRLVTRGSKRFRFSKVITPAAFGLSLCCLVAGAVTGGFYIEPGAVEADTYEPPVIFVKATKSLTAYDSVEGSAPNLKFSVKVHGQCDEGYHLSSGDLYVRGQRGQKLDYPVNKDHRSIGPDHGKGWNDFRFSVPFMLPDPAQGSLVDLCNAALKGKSKEELRQVLQTGFTFHLKKAYHAVLGITCDKDHPIGLYEPPTYAAETYLPVTVRCVPTGYHTTQGPPAPPTSGPPIASLSV